MDDSGFDEQGTYLVLPSNAQSPDGNNRNTMSNYKIGLPQPWNLPSSDSYEVALVQISYPHSWRQKISLKPCLYQITMASLDDPAKAPYFLDTCDTDTKTSTVNTLKEVINAINARKPKQWKGEFSVNNMGKVTTKLHRGEGILLDYNLANLLGFQSSKYLFVDGKIILPKKKGGLNKDDDDDDDSDRGDTNTFTIG